MGDRPKNFTKPSRKTLKLTYKICDNVRKMIALGKTKTSICAAINIYYNTFLSWEKKGAEIAEKIANGECPLLSESDKRYFYLYWSCESGKSDLEQKCLQTINDVMESEHPFKLKAAMWMLEKKFPDYSDKTQKDENTRIIVNIRMNPEDGKDEKTVDI